MTNTIIKAYHGTPFKFKEFKDTDKRYTENETNNIGFWFTNLKKVAVHFTTTSEQYYAESGEFWDDGTPKKVSKTRTRYGRIYEVNLHMKNPKIFIADESNKAEKQRKVEELCDHINKLDKDIYYCACSSERCELIRQIHVFQKERDALRRELTTDGFEVFMNYRDQFCQYIGHEKGDCSWKERFILENKNEANAAFVQSLQEQGYDSIVIKNTKYDSHENGLIDQYVVFSPENIEIISCEQISKCTTRGDRKRLKTESIKRLHSFF